MCLEALDTCEKDVFFVLHVDFWNGALIVDGGLKQGAGRSLMTFQIPLWPCFSVLLTPQNMV